MDMREIIIIEKSSIFYKAISMHYYPVLSSPGNPQPRTVFNLHAGFSIRCCWVFSLIQFYCEKFYGLLDESVQQKPFLCSFAAHSLPSPKDKTR